MTTSNPPFEPAAMAARRQQYFAFVRSQAPLCFQADGSYRETTEPDGRIAYWILPAFLSAPDAADRELGLRIYEQGAGWNGYGVFMSSCVAANYIRHSEVLTPELRQRSEEHLARFTVDEDGRKASAGIYDYMFHGYNDNMPSMATRTMILAGDILDRKDFTDMGLFNLEGLGAHFERRGLLSEYTSATYTPISLCALLDIAECSRCAEARELAAACTNRILLDLVGHWHWDTGTTGGPMSRAYTTDVTETLSNLNAYMWYVSGHPLTIDPRDALRDDSFPGPMHHARNHAFCMAQFVELMNASHETISKEIKAFARKPKPYPYEIRGTTDWGASGSEGGSVGYQTRSFQRKLWWLGTAADTATGSMAGQHLLFHGVCATAPEPQDWRDRVPFWHRLIADSPDQGEEVETSWTKPGPHKGAFGTEKKIPDTVIRSEADHVTDVGRYVTAQKGGSALVLGSVSPDLEGKEVAYLRYSVFFGTFLRMPDEIFENNTPLARWDGEAALQSWQFLRFGDVYVGVRLSAMVSGERAPVRRVIRHRYLRVETPLIDHSPRVLDSAFGNLADFACVFEIADKDEVGDFATFRREVMAATWELYHSFNRNSRYVGRHGELQINDSPTRNTARFIAVDGKVEEPAFFTATGLDPKLVQLFPDGRRVVQRRICYRPDFVGSPYYDKPWQVLEADIPGPDRSCCP